MRLPLVLFAKKIMEHFKNILGNWTINVIKCCFKDFGSSQWVLMILNSVLDSLKAVRLHLISGKQPSATLQQAKAPKSQT